MDRKIQTASKCTCSSLYRGHGTNLLHPDFSVCATEASGVMVDSQPSQAELVLGVLKAWRTGADYYSAEH